MWPHYQTTQVNSSIAIAAYLSVNLEPELDAKSAGLRHKDKRGSGRFPFSFLRRKSNIFSVENNYAQLLSKFVR